MLEIPSPPSSWPSLQDGQLGTVFSPAVSGSPSAVEFERRRVGESSGWKLQGPGWRSPPALGAFACLRSAR